MVDAGAGDGGTLGRDVREAVVVEKPFVDPRKQTPKG